MTIYAHCFWKVSIYVDKLNNKQFIVSIYLVNNGKSYNSCNEREKKNFKKIFITVENFLSLMPHSQWWMPQNLIQSLKALICDILGMK
jgi:hypothetical protein